MQGNTRHSLCRVHDRLFIGCVAVMTFPLHLSLKLVASFAFAFAFAFLTRRRGLAESTRPAGCSGAGIGVAAVRVSALPVEMGRALWIKCKAHATLGGGVFVDSLAGLACPHVGAGLLGAVPWTKQ